MITYSQPPAGTNALSLSFCGSTLAEWCEVLERERLKDLCWNVTWSDIVYALLTTEFWWWSSETGWSFPLWGFQLLQHTSTGQQLGLGLGSVGWLLHLTRLRSAFCTTCSCSWHFFLIWCILDRIGSCTTFHLFILCHEVLSMPEVWRPRGS